MTRAWLMGCAVAAAMAVVPLACSDDETTAAGPTSGPTSTSSAASSNASTGAMASSAATGGSAGMGGMGQGGAGGQGGGSPGDLCEMCTDPLVDPGVCDQFVDACFADATCAMWGDCYDTCFDDNDFTAACYGACDTTYQSASGLYEPLLTCVCNACSSECAPLCT